MAALPVELRHFVVSSVKSKPCPRPVVFNWLQRRSKGHVALEDDSPDTWHMSQHFGEGRTLNAALFEPVDSLDELGKALRSSPPTAQVDSLVDSLVRLLGSDVAAADRLRREAIAHGTPIAPHAAFKHHCFSRLQAGDFVAYLDWLPLVPIRASDSAVLVGHVEMATRTWATDEHALARFLRILLRKGDDAHPALEALLRYLATGVRPSKIKDLSRELDGCDSVALRDELRRGLARQAFADGWISAAVQIAQRVPDNPLDDTALDHNEGQVPASVDVPGTPKLSFADRDPLQTELRRLAAGMQQPGRLGEPFADEVARATETALAAGWTEASLAVALGGDSRPSAGVAATARALMRVYATSPQTAPLAFSVFRSTFASVGVASGWTGGDASEGLLPDHRVLATLYDVLLTLNGPDAIDTLYESFLLENRDMGARDAWAVFDVFVRRYMGQGNIDAALSVVQQAEERIGRPLLSLWTSVAELAAQTAIGERSDDDWTARRRAYLAMGILVRMHSSNDVDETTGEPHLEDIATTTSSSRSPPSGQAPDPSLKARFAREMPRPMLETYDRIEAAFRDVRLLRHAGMVRSLRQDRWGWRRKAAQHAK